MLDDVPEAPDAFVRALALSVSEVASALSMLELKGLVRRTYGGHLVTDAGAAQRTNREIDTAGARGDERWAATPRSLPRERVLAENLVHLVQNRSAIPGSSSQEGFEFPFLDLLQDLKESIVDENEFVSTRLDDQLAPSRLTNRNAQAPRCTVVTGGRAGGACRTNSVSRGSEYQRRGHGIFYAPQAIRTTRLRSRRCSRVSRREKRCKPTLTTFLCHLEYQIVECRFGPDVVAAINVDAGSFSSVNDHPRGRPLGLVRP